MRLDSDFDALGLATMAAESDLLVNKARETLNPI
jgi:hypothetical protein